MYQEKIAQITEDHLRTHIAALLADANAQFPDDDVATLVVPKTITSASRVGGVAQDLPKLLPMYAVDCMSKSFGGEVEDLWLYAYDGHIAGMVSAQSQETVDQLCKRHASAVERFVRNHQFLHLASNDEFTIREFFFVASDFSGAEEFGQRDNKKPLWLGAFRIDVRWVTSEDGANDHG